MITTTTVRTAVARFEFTPSIPILASMDVNEAKPADKTANKTHIEKFRKSLYIHLAARFKSRYNSKNCEQLYMLIL